MQTVRKTLRQVVEEAAEASYEARRIKIRRQAVA